MVIDNKSDEQIKRVVEYAEEVRQQIRQQGQAMQQQIR